ncbi:MAG: UDP-N-acetylglucosamine 1-carboxyvinyltransferase [bacterium]
MERICILGGRPLEGQINISGAKNAALPALAATLLVEGVCTIGNMPRVKDVYTMLELLKNLGARIEVTESDDSLLIRVDTTTLHDFIVSYGLVKTMRASVLVLGPLVARFGKANVSLPGGCAIGARPINFHLKGLKILGARIALEEGYVIARAQKMQPGKIEFEFPTVTGTENLMMVAATIEGETVIENVAREPEIIDLANMLGKMGAQIEGAGTGRIKIRGSSSLKPVEHHIIPDRIEAGTFMTAAAITKGKVRIKRCPKKYLCAVIEKLREIGTRFIDVGDNEIEVMGADEIRAVDLRTSPYPGFPTDMQAQFMALLCIACGVSIVTETVFENRFMHACELGRMGADIRIEGHSAIVRGVRQLKGAPVMATDLRASACLILAGLAAKGETIVSRIYHLDRGYDKIEKKFQQLGAIIRREREII